MKKTIVLFCLLFSCAIWSQAKLKPQPEDFYLDYSSFSKTIIVKGNSITIQEWTEQYDNPVSSMPGSRKEVIKTLMISQDDLSSLKSLIKESGFMSLPKNEYGAKPTERHYPFSISVNSKGKQKRIEYRSNPDPATEQAPKAFSEVEKKLNELATGKKL